MEEINGKKYLQMEYLKNLKLNTDLLQAGLEYQYLAVKLLGWAWEVLNQECLKVLMVE